MRYLFFILGLLIASGQMSGRVFYTESRRINGGAVVLAGEHLPADSLTLYAAEVRCAMADAAVRRRESASWQLSWPSSGQYIALEFDNGGLIDGTDRPTATVVTDNGCGTVVRTPVKSGLDFHGGANTLCLEWRDGTASVFVGKNRLHGVTTLAMPCPLGSCTVSTSGKATLVDAAVEIEAAPRLDSGLTADSVEAYFADEYAPRRPMEGIWEYLDRDTDPALAVEGGRYRLAIMADGNGTMRIIYLGGAVTNARAWREGMVKGTITDLGFTDHYRLHWLDAMQQPMEAESYATLNSPAVISFTFPLHSATLRFRKITR